jgi:phosphopantetheinyl transferase
MTGTGTSPPQEARVDVWLVEVDGTRDPGARSDAWLLDDGERSALTRLRLADDRRNYFAAHVLLRLALSRVTDGRVRPACWRFERSQGGRPSVVAAGQMPHPDFSLSRSSGLVAVAVSSANGCQVGVDAERYDRRLYCMPEDVALSPAERSHLARRPSERRQAEFLTRWTLKEAYGKLRGCGICVPLQRLEVGVSAAGRARLVRTEEGLSPRQELHLQSRRIRARAGQYCTSLAIHCPPGVRPRAVVRLLDTLWPDAGEVPRLPADENAPELRIECEATR